MEKIVKNLTNMKMWVDFSLPPPAEFKTKTESMRFVAEVMNRCLYLLKIGAASAPNAETAKIGYTKSKAIIVAHMAQLGKLYEGALIHICGSQPELTRIFFRPILEVSINTKRLIQSKEKLCPNVGIASYPSELEMFRMLESKVKERALTPIEHRINELILSQLKKDGISREELTCNNQEDIEKKNVPPSCENSNYNDSLYMYLFQKETDWVHRGWRDLRSYHLTQTGDYYVPDLGFDEPQPRLGCQLTQVCLETLTIYLKWNQSDPDNELTSIIRKLLKLNAALDEAHENTLGDGLIN